MFKMIFIDISGMCNAKCHWCQTGFANKNGEAHKKFMSPNQFAAIIEYLQQNDFLCETTEIHLYNWGEPLIHPQFNEFVEILSVNNLNWGISTNASKVPHIKPNIDCSGLKSLVFSCCGYSQASYDHIHGFNAKKIRSNIIEIINLFNEKGSKGNILMNFHVYQFNPDELFPLYKFCFDNKITFAPTYATINDWNHAKQFLKGNLPYDYLEKASKELFLSVLEKSIKNRPKKIKECSQMKYMNIDVNGDVILCCGASNKVDEIFNLTPKLLQKARNESSECKECKELGVDWVFTQNRSPEALLKLLYAKLDRWESGSCIDSRTLIKLVQGTWRALGVTGTTIAIMGAGEHSRWLDEAVNHISGPKVVALLDDNEKEGNKRFSLSPVNPLTFNPKTVDAILLSSDHPKIIEHMELRCKKLYGNKVPLIKLYEDFPQGPYNKQFLEKIINQMEIAK